MDSDIIKWFNDLEVKKYTMMVIEYKFYTIFIKTELNDTYTIMDENYILVDMFKNDIINFLLHPLNQSYETIALYSE